LRVETPPHIKHLSVHETYPTCIGHTGAMLILKEPKAHVLEDMSLK